MTCGRRFGQCHASEADLGERRIAHNVHHVDDEKVVGVHEEPNTSNDDELEFTPRETEEALLLLLDKGEGALLAGALPGIEIRTERHVVFRERWGRRRRVDVVRGTGGGSEDHEDKSCSEGRGEDGKERDEQSYERYLYARFGKLREGSSRGD
jgi:hypothetical protein